MAPSLALRSGHMIEDLIFDLGMNNGDDTDFYLRKGFRVVAVEANPDLCALAVQRFAPEIENGRLRIVKKAISKATGEIELFINEQVSGWSTTNQDWLKARNHGETKTRAVRVPAATFEEILREYGVPYYVKSDIQGAEPLCLEALLEFEDRPRFVSISTGLDVVGADAMQHIRKGIELFSRLGYRKFKIIPQQHTELQRCPFPRREGLYIDYRFKHGSSGLFGNELPGDWIGAKQTWREYWKIVMSYKFAGNSRSPYGWFNNLPSRTIRSYLDRLFWRGVGWYDTHAMWER